MPIELPKVMLGVPTHKSDIHSAIVPSLLMASSSQAMVHYKMTGLSLLAKNFNLMLSEAIARKYDYFVMLHSDVGIVGIQDGKGSWIDCLIELARDLQAAVVSVIIPIKSPEGVTSTGLELDSEDHFSLRRLTVRESLSLHGEFIGRADLCKLFQVEDKTAGAFLVNTGCSIYNLRAFNWRAFPGFYIDDWIEWTEEQPVCKTIPEDWSMSRWLHDCQWPYFATRKIMVNHVGVGLYNNFSEWGVENEVK